MVTLYASALLPAHIRHLLHSLTESNSQTLFRELAILAQEGTDECILILKSCLDHLNINGNDLKNVQLEPLYGLVFRYMLNRPNVGTILCESLRSVEINVDVLTNLSRALHLTLPEKVGFGLALLTTENPSIRTCGRNFCMTQLGELCGGLVSVDLAEQIHSILKFLRSSVYLSEHTHSFMQMLSEVDLKDEDRLILASFHSDEMHNTYLSSNLVGESCEFEFDYFLEEMEKKKGTVNIIKELGYGLTTTVSQCKEVLSLFSPMTELTVAMLLGTITRTHTGLEDNQDTYLAFSSTIGNRNFSDIPPLNSCNTDILIDSINQLVPGIKWIQVIGNLDHEGFYIPNEAAFSFFLAIFRRACQDPFPLHAICGPVWKNKEGQVSFLKYAVSVPPEVFTFAHSERQLKYSDKSQLEHSNNAWLCLDLLEVLCQLAECGHAKDVRSMLKQPLEQCPEVLLLGMAHVNTAYNLLQNEVSSTVFPKMLNSSTGSGMILNLWNVNPNFLLRGFLDADKSNPDNMGRILDICQELKILSTVLDMVHSCFGIKLAAIASQRQLVDLEKWLSSKLVVYKDSFFEECLKFLKDVGASRDISSQLSSQSGSIWNHYSDMTAVLMKVLQAHVSLIISTELLEEMGKLVATFTPAALAMKGGESNGSTPSDGDVDSIEMEAASYFMKMFFGEITIDVMIQMLVRFKESADQRERSLFDCIVGDLFEEYKLVPKYPEMKLKLFAVLFGSLIKHQVLTHLTLGYALRGVLDALRKPPDSKMFLFGAIALEQFVNRLIEWPQCCSHMLQIPHLRVTKPELFLSIERELAKFPLGVSKSDIPSSSSMPMTGSVSKTIATQVSNPVRLDESKNHPVHSSSDVSATDKSQSSRSVLAALSSSTGTSQPSLSTTSARFGSALNIETLVAAAERKGYSLEAPSSEIQDKVSFVINNLSASNFEAKANDFSEILKESYHPWFAQYMVIKRASIEPNLHDLYLKFFDKVSSRSLNKEIVEATYENCKVLLGSELIKSSSEERSLLKNLGSLLGKLTIGRNQVLRAQEIDLKTLILEAYEKGMMIAIIPFTSKVLEQCQNSTAYKRPNPYTMSIVGLLTEIYTKPNLKMSLKFEIEVLFKKLGVDVKDVTPTSLLKDKVRQVEGNHDFSNKDVNVDQQHFTGDVKTKTVSPKNEVDVPPKVASPSHPSGHSINLSQLLTATSQQVVVNTKLQSLGLYMHFQRVLPIVVERAVKETASCIVQRSVSIAAETTKNLILKDYAMEADETRIRNSAHKMVASLAASLAHVTCKVPLRDSLSTQLRSSLQGLNYASEVVEQAVQMVTYDNLDLGCVLIEQSAIEKGIQAIDADLPKQLSIIRKQRERVSSDYFDPANFPQGNTRSLPDALRPKSGRLSHPQRVYEDFIKLPWVLSDTGNAGVTATPHASVDNETRPTRHDR